MSGAQVKFCTSPGMERQTQINSAMSQEEECYLLWAILHSLADTSSLSGHVLGSSLAWGPCIPVWNCFKFDAKCEGTHLISPCATLCPSQMWLYKQCSNFHEKLCARSPGEHCGASICINPLYCTFFLPRNLLGNCWEFIWLQTLGSLDGCPGRQVHFPCWVSGRLVQQHPCSWKQLADKQSECHTVTGGHCWG